MLSPFVDSPTSIDSIPSISFGELSNFRFSEFVLSVQGVVIVASELGTLIFLVFSTLIGIIFIPITFFIVLINVYFTLGLFGTMILGFNAIIGLFWFLEHLETISGIISGIVNAVGSWIPFT